MVQSITNNLIDNSQQSLDDSSLTTRGSNAPEQSSEDFCVESKKMKKRPCGDIYLIKSNQLYINQPLSIQRSLDYNLITNSND